MGSLRRLESSGQANVMLTSPGGEYRFPAHRNSLTYSTIGLWSSLSNYHLTTQLPAWLATNNLLQISLFAPIRQLGFLHLNSLQSLT